MSTPVVEFPVPSFSVDVNYGSESFSNDYDEVVAALIRARWRQAVEYAPTPVAEPKVGLFKRLLPRKSQASLYQAGPLLVAITTTALAVSRPVMTTGTGVPVKPPVLVTHVLHDKPAQVELRGKGRDLHGILPPGSVSPVSGPRGHTIDDWDF